LEGREEPEMFDERFVEALATELAARIVPQIENGSRSARTTVRLLTVKEAAAYIGRTEQAVQHLIHRRELIVVRRGRRVHVDRGDLDRWIEANKV
jgi:excisionase family DNA binding protein